MNKIVKCLNCDYSLSSEDKEANLCLECLRRFKLEEQKEEYESEKSFDPYEEYINRSEFI